MDGARTPAEGQAKGAAKVVRERLGARHHCGVLRDGVEHLDDIDVLARGFLRSPLAERVRRRLPGDYEHRNPVGESAGDARQEIRRPGSRRSGAHRDLAADAGEAVGEERGPFLVFWHDQHEVLVRLHGCHERMKQSPGNGEDVAHPFVLEMPEKDVDHAPRLRLGRECLERGGLNRVPLSRDVHRAHEKRRRAGRCFVTRSASASTVKRQAGHRHAGIFTDPDYTTQCQISQLLPGFGHRLSWSCLYWKIYPERRS